MIFTMRQLQKKCGEKDLLLYLAFFDHTKAFDTTNQVALWSILLHFGCIMKFVTIFRLLHDDMEVVALACEVTMPGVVIHWYPLKARLFLNMDK
eukprot:g45264.t1